MAHQWLSFRSTILLPYGVALLVALAIMVGSFMLRGGLAAGWLPVVQRVTLAAILVLIAILAAVCYFRVYVSGDTL